MEGRHGLNEQGSISALTFLSDAPVACSMTSSKTSNALGKDLDLLASVSSPSSTVSRKVSLVGSTGFKEYSEKSGF